MLNFTNDIRNQRVIFSKKIQSEVQGINEVVNHKDLGKIIRRLKIHFLRTSNVFSEQNEPNLSSSSLLL